jgi:hypothetical protein
MRERLSFQATPADGCHIIKHGKGTRVSRVVGSTQEYASHRTRQFELVLDLRIELGRTLLHILALHLGQNLGS